MLLIIIIIIIIMKHTITGVPCMRTRGVYCGEASIREINWTTKTTSRAARDMVVVAYVYFALAAVLSRFTRANRPFTAYFCLSNQRAGQACNIPHT